MSTEIPSDSIGRPLYTITPRGLALARTVKALTSSFLIVFTGSTTVLRVSAIAKDVYLKWATNDEDSCKATNFDEMIIAGTYVDLYVPLKADGTNYSRAHFIGREAGATVVVVEK